MIDKIAPFEEALLLVEKLSPLESRYRLWPDLNLDISEEDIAEARREMWHS